MRLKTEIHVNVDLHFDSDEPANEGEIARLAAVCDGLYMLLKAQRTDPAAVQEAPRTITTTEPPSLPVSKPAPSATKRTSRKSDFDEFDQLVRAEMQRLAIDGRMPGGPRWDAERSPGMPTMTNVLHRYRNEFGIEGTAALAACFGLLPALKGGAAYRTLAATPPASTNGQHEPRRSL